MTLWVLPLGWEGGAERGWWLCDAAWLPVHGMALGEAGSPTGKGILRGWGGRVAQGELPLHPALLWVQYLLHGPGIAVSLPGPGFSICETGTFITEPLYTLRSAGRVFGLLNAAVLRV